MDMSTGINLGQLLLALGVLLVTSGIAWGTLFQRVQVLEKEIEGLSDLKTNLARIDERTEHIKSGMDALTNSWLFQPPPAYGPNIGPTKPKPTRGRAA